MRRDVFQAKFGTQRDAAFAEPMRPDVALSAVIGPSPLPRNELIKRLWDYIRAHGLQDEREKMMINPDAALRLVVGGRRRVNIIELMKMMSAHLRPVTG